MSVVCDTNVILRFQSRWHDEFAEVGAAVGMFLEQGMPLYYTQQIRRELWNVMTRPGTQNGLGLETQGASDRILHIDSYFRRLPDHPDAGEIWDRLVVQYEVRGKAVHDAQIVATMLAHGMRTLLTQNHVDFARYAPEIEVLNPADFGAPPAEPS